MSQVKLDRLYKGDPSGALDGVGKAHHSGFGERLLAGRQSLGPGIGKML